jgi:hypothetical protein
MEVRTDAPLTACERISQAREAADPRCRNCGNPASWHSDFDNACPDDDGPHHEAETPRTDATLSGDDTAGTADHNRAAGELVPCRGCSALIAVDPNRDYCADCITDNGEQDAELIATVRRTDEAARAALRGER